MQKTISLGILCATLVWSCSAAGTTEPVYDKKLYPDTFPKTTELPERYYAHITTDGTYTFAASSNNIAGKGETVPIAKEYYIAKYATTNEEWAAFINSTRRKSPKYWTNGAIPSGREKHPVLWVSYEEAMAYCDYLELSYPDYDFRLPTQAEWEFAAIGNSGSKYPWGNSSDITYDGKTLTSKFNFNAVISAYILQTPDKIATYNNIKSPRYGDKEAVKHILSIGKNGSLSGWIDHSRHTGFVYTDLFTEINKEGGYTCAVDAYPEGASHCGCYNMAGNCWEWTSSTEIAQNGAEKGQFVNVIRGGSWYATASSCRASYRGEGRKASAAYATVGLRVVATKK